MISLVIFGGRDFSDYTLLYVTMKNFIKTVGMPNEIISGAASGADYLGANWARSHGIPVINKPAEWNRYGKSAGYRRNEEMASIATHAIGFWDGKSKGTSHMISICEKRNIPLMIIYY